MEHKLPKLPYDYAALEPHFDEETMRVHHTKHHQAYTDKFNAALQKHPQLQQKEAELFQPVMEKAQAAIEKVAKANGFTYVFDLGAGGLLYFSEQSVDILPLVKKELGIE